MAEAESRTDSHDQAAYNATAVDVAATLHGLRKQHAEATRPGTPSDADSIFPDRNRISAGVALEYAAMGEQPVSDALQARADAAGITFEHLAITIGTVLHGVDLQAGWDDDLIALIRSTLLERKVIFFRDQHLDETRQAEFGRAFGPLDAFPFGKPGEDPYILEIIHDREAPGTENGWHTDVTWMERPSLGSIAQCVEVPPFGGDTLFADSHAVYRGLPTVLQERIRYLDAIHDYRLFLTTRAPGGLPEEVEASIKQRIPFGVAHPLVRVHPETGKPGLYLHGGFLRHDSLHDRRTGEALDPEASRAICRELLTQHSRPEVQCRFRWTAGSMAFWDNRAVQHYAVSDYWPHRRVLRRVTVAGDRPVGLD